MSTVKVEKGQKYRGNASYTRYEIVSDPFDVDGEPWIAFLHGDTKAPICGRVSSFEGDTFTLITEPKYKIGDRVKGNLQEEYTIEAVATKTDHRGQFVYLVRSGNVVFSLAEKAILRKVGT